MLLFTVLLLQSFGFGAEEETAPAPVSIEGYPEPVTIDGGEAPPVIEINGYHTLAELEEAHQAELLQECLDNDETSDFMCRVSYGAMTADDEEIWNALKQASTDEFLELEEMDRDHYLYKDIDVMLSSENPSETITHDGETETMKLHLKQEGLAECPEASLELKAVNTDEVHSYDGEDFLEADCDLDEDGEEDCHSMFALSIRDSAVEVTILDAEGCPGPVIVKVDGYIHDNEETKERRRARSYQCGSEWDHLSPECFRTSEPEIFANSIPTVKLHQHAHGTMCTAFKVAGNMFVTNAHCVCDDTRQVLFSENFNHCTVKGSEVEFEFEKSYCTSDTASYSWLKTSKRLVADKLIMWRREAPEHDFALFTVKDSAAAWKFGHVKLDNTKPKVGDALYIIGHPDGSPQSVVKDENAYSMQSHWSSGFCSSGYVRGWDGQGTASQAACNAVCIAESDCTFAAWETSGLTCSRYNGATCNHQGDWHGVNHVTFKKKLNSARCKVTFSENSGYFGYNCDISGGSSGSPVFGPNNGAVGVNWGGGCHANGGRNVGTSLASMWPYVASWIYSCENKPKYVGECPNYYNCHYTTAYENANMGMTPCSCVSFCEYDSRCCEAGGQEDARTCDNKPHYMGQCPNYYNCHLDGDCSCLDYCDYDSRCCLGEEKTVTTVPVYTCSNKPAYTGACPNYYGCAYSGDCSCLDYCNVDSRCCDSRVPNFKSDVRRLEEALGL